MAAHPPVSHPHAVPSVIALAVRRARRATAAAILTAAGTALLFSPSALARTHSGGGAALASHAPSTGPAPTNPDPVTGIGEASRLVAAALTRVGSPYETGATGPGAFDCSGLVTWAAQRVGVHVPRVSFAQYRTGRRVNRRHIHAGDLVFFDTDGPGASDVGIATGPRTEVSATVHGGVMVHPIFDDYWGSHFVGARRLSHR